MQWRLAGEAAVFQDRIDGTVWEFPAPGWVSTYPEQGFSARYRSGQAVLRTDISADRIE
jgi:hypothetical protein